MPVWMRKRFEVHNFASEIVRVDKLLADRQGPKDVLMVSERHNADEEFVYIWLNDESLCGFFPDFAKSEAPTSVRPVFLAGLLSVYDEHFPPRKW